MADVDYESEYNNRMRVPEYADIFLRWAREAEEYRAERLKAGRAELGLSYGDTPRQTVDLLLPDAGESAPLAMFVHGGWWRSLEASSFSQMARGLNARGIAVAVAGYDLCPNITIADIIEQVRRACVFLWQRQPHRLLVYGHSAGGHLASAMVATDWHALYPKAPADLVPGRICDFGRVRSRPARGYQREPGFAARCCGSAPRVDGVLAARARSDVRCRRWRTRIRRVQAPKQISCRYLASGRRANAL